MINIAGEHSAVNLAMAEADSLQSDYEKAVTALHTLVLSEWSFYYVWIYLYKIGLMTYASHFNSCSLS